MIWQLPDRTMTFERPLVMGIVNVTPDSFSDGGRFFDPEKAVDHAMKLIDEGADLLDIGGESTRPGATPVEEKEELSRVIPVIEELRRRTTTPISIDTMKSTVAKAAIKAGVAIVNDVTGFRCPEMIHVCRQSSVAMIVMHMSGTPMTMQLNPAYADVVNDTVTFFQQRLHELTGFGIEQSRITIDPGIGFGKTLEQTITQLRYIKAYSAMGRPICLGVSRKGFLGQITGRDRFERLSGTLAVNSFAIAMGAAQIIRVHDVAAHRDAARLAGAILTP